MNSDRRGFTLIELLIVVVIIGILAAIAIPKYANTKGKTYIAAMKSDLRNLVTAQEAYLSQNTTYYNGPVPSATLTSQVTTGVHITLQGVSATGWAATSWHDVISETCTIFYGSSTVSPAVTEGVPVCQ